MRIAVVVQRFGREILGGAETHAGVVARILARHHDVEVLTSTAGDYQTWSEAFPAGESYDDGLRIRRFPVARGRAASWDAMAALLHDGLAGSDFARSSQAAKAAFAARVRAWPDPLQEEFVRAQGPLCPDLHAHLRRASYDGVLFFTYLYPTTYDGLSAVPRGRAFVIPTLHDEVPAYLPVFGRRLARARLLCSTDAEVALIARLYPSNPPSACRIGYGIPLPAREMRLKAEPPPFLLYAGRIDSQKGVGDLIEGYRALREALPDAPALKLIGERAMPLPEIPGLEVLGFVDEAEKDRLMREALALVHLSPYESLGIVLLEAMARETPILVNGASEVMVEHCRRGGGVWVRDAAGFVAAVRRLLADPELVRRLGRAGRVYVEEEYGLPAYERRLLEVFPAGPQSSPKLA
jgi:glycosyltransferase involved in cell wall biosynthesis